MWKTYRQKEHGFGFSPLFLLQASTEHGRPVYLLTSKFPRLRFTIFYYFGSSINEMGQINEASVKDDITLNNKQYHKQ